MSDLSGNKIIGAVLATTLLIAGLGIGVPMLFPHEPPTKSGDLIVVSADTTAGPAAEVDTPPDWGTVLKTADVSAGEAKMAVCKACHILDSSGANNIGPGLYGVEGRKPGSHAAFSYSAGMLAFSAKQPVWDYEHIYEFLKGPGAYISGTKMTYQGMKLPQDRINVIAYLHTLGSSLPIPPPNPAAAAPAAGAPPPVAGATAKTPPAGAVAAASAAPATTAVAKTPA
jgi:cytochrome c